MCKTLDLLATILDSVLLQVNSSDTMLRDLKNTSPQPVAVHCNANKGNTDLHVGRGPRQGLHIDTPLLRVQPEGIERSFLQQITTA